MNGKIRAYTRSLTPSSFLANKKCREERREEKRTEIERCSYLRGVC